MINFLYKEEVLYSSGTLRDSKYKLVARLWPLGSVEAELLVTLAT